MVMRRTHPEVHRPFRTPFMPVVPILGILICGYMMYGLPVDTWLRLAIWMALGLAIYFLYGRRHSKLNTPGA
jgi:APA family basic amino acid/polyamine antiporter